MGWIRHHAILVTGWQDNKLEEAKKKAEEFGNITTEIVAGNSNGYMTFVVVPDGSKEGWDRSDEGNDARDKFIEWLESQRYGDNSSYFYWVEVMYGSDDWDAKVTRHAWQTPLKLDDE